MDKVIKGMRKEIFIGEISTKAKSMDMENIIGVMGVTMQENSKTARNRAKVYGNLTSKRSIIKGLIKTEKEKGMECMFGRMALSTKDTITKI